VRTPKWYKVLRYKNADRQFRKKFLTYMATPNFNSYGAEEMATKEVERQKKWRTK
jgi:hypothetical protein